MDQFLGSRPRQRAAAKRGGGGRRLALDDAAIVARERSVDLAALDEALIRLASFDPRLGRIVELRFFGGLTIAETAEVLGISPATVKRDWTIAKAWLRRELGEGGADDQKTSPEGA